MDYSRFTESAAGNLVPTLYGAKAFVPNKLPPKIDMNEIALPMAQTTASVGELRGACRRLTNPFMLIRPLQLQEALTSSAMEGTHTTDDELILAEAGIQKNPSSETQEVANYRRALSEALSRIKTEPLTNRLLRDAHRTLLSNVGRMRGSNKLPGEFKREQNMIGGYTLDTARYIPPPPQETLDCMSDLEKYINREDKTNHNTIIDMALVHYQIEAIHPFSDGNGRVGRMLLSLMAVQDNLLDSPALYLSPVIERHKDEYIDRMFAVSCCGDWGAWLRFFFKVVEQSCRETVETIDRLIALQESYRDIAATAVKSTNVLSIIDMLFDTPVLTVRDIVDQIGITDVAARKLLARLVDLEILYEYTEVYPKAFLALGIIQAAKPPQSTQSARPSAS